VSGRSWNKEDAKKSERSGDDGREVDFLKEEREKTRRSARAPPKTSPEADSQIQLHPPRRRAPPTMRPKI